MRSGSNNFMAKCRLLAPSTTSQTWLVWPFARCLSRRYPPITSSATSSLFFASGPQARTELPVFLNVNVAHDLGSRLVHSKTAFFQNLDHSAGLWIYLLSIRP